MMKSNFQPSSRYIIALCSASFALVSLAGIPQFLSFDIYWTELSISCDSSDEWAVSILNGKNIALSRQTQQTVPFIWESFRLYENDCLVGANNMILIPVNFLVIAHNVHLERSLVQCPPLCTTYGSLGCSSLSTSQGVDNLPITLHWGHSSLHLRFVKFMQTLWWEEVVPWSELVCAVVGLFEWSTSSFHELVTLTCKRVQGMNRRIRQLDISIEFVQCRICSIFLDDSHDCIVYTHNWRSAR